MEFEKQFDKEFVKDCGPNIQPIFRDPVGDVGPVKQFIREIISQSIEEERKRVEEWVSNNSEMHISGDDTLYWVRRDDLLAEIKKGEK